MEMELQQYLGGLWQELGLQGKAGLWIFEVFVVVLATLVASFILSRIFARIARRLERTNSMWDGVLLEAIGRPATILVWVVGLSWAVQMIQLEGEDKLLSLVDPVREIATILLFSWALIRLVAGGEQAVMEPGRLKKPMDPTTAHAIGKLLKASVIITTVLVVLQNLGYSISGVLAFGGIGGIAIGFAAKDLLANFFGGLMIYLDRPFKVGDWIRSPDQEIEGTVEYIGWRQSRIRTFDKRPLYVPNATFANISVENPSRMKNRRIYETIGLRYDDAAKVKVVVDKVREMLLNHPEIDHNQTLIVNFNAFGASSLNFFVYTFTKTTDWATFHQVKEDVLLKIVAIVEGEGAEFAFPTTTVHLPDLQLPSGERLPAKPPEGEPVTPES